MLFKAIVVFALVAVAVAKEKREASSFDSTFPQSTYSGVPSVQGISPSSYEGYGIGSSFLKGGSQFGQGVSGFYQPPVYPGAGIDASSYYGAQPSLLSSRFGGGRSASSVYGQYDPLYSAVDSYSAYQPKGILGNRFGLESDSSLGIPSTYGNVFQGQAYNPYTSAVYGGPGQASTYQPFAQEAARYQYQPYGQVQGAYEQK